MNRIYGAIVILSVAIAGCTPAAVKDMSGEPPAPWVDLQVFLGEPMMSIGYPRERGDWAAVKKALQAPSFAEAVTAFESSPLPDAHSDRQAQKDAAVKAWRDAIETAKAGSNDEVKAKVEAATAANAALVESPS